jgi:hypothetical protein
MDFKKDFSVSPPVVGAAQVKSDPDLITSPPVPPVPGFSAEEKEVYEYICQVLREEGVAHFTAGISIVVIVRTYVDWGKAWIKCNERGRTQTSKTGYESPLPWAEDEKRLKMELNQWLPKACLTIPSLARTRKDTGEKSGQDDLFGDLVNHAMSSPAKRSIN